jgi:hypothetical protein
MIVGIVAGAVVLVLIIGTLNLQASIYVLCQPSLHTVWYLDEENKKGTNLLLF